MTKSQLGMSGRDVAAMQSAALGGDTVPVRVLLTPWGTVESTNGSFIVDEESARLVIESFAEHATDLPIDYEHQTLGGAYASPSGQAPAAGWIKRIAAEPGVGLLAEIEWTAGAREMLAKREYRYLSPVAVVRRDDRKLTAIHSAALTNKPAIVGMSPIVNREASDASAGDSESVMMRMREELALPGDAGVEELLVAAGRRLTELTREAAERNVKQRIRDAMTAGKLVESQRAWAEELVMRDEAMFDRWLHSAPVIVRLGHMAAPNINGAHTTANRAETRARSEFRAQPFLASLTSEAAYVAQAAREADQ